MTPQLLAATLYAVMVQLAPPERLSKLPSFEPAETRETAEERHARYRRYAFDVAQVALDPHVEPLPGGRVATAEWLLGVGHHESGFARDADVGPCLPAPKGRCDRGRSFCSMQIQIGEGRTIQGWTGKQLFEDRQKCFRAALGLLRQSFVGCKTQPVEYRLSLYTAGNCDNLIGHVRSRELYQHKERVHRFWDAARKKAETELAARAAQDAAAAAEHTGSSPNATGK